MDISEEQQGWESADSSDGRGLKTASLRSDEAYYKSLFRDLPHGIVETNRDGKIVFSNPAHHKMLGFSDGELIGRYVFDLMPDESQRLRYRAYLRDILITQPKPKPYRSQHVTTDGQIVETLADWTYKRDDQDRITGFVAIITDITARVCAENSLLESEDRYRLLAENAKDIISRCSPEGCYTYVSRACETILGYKPAELLGKNMQDFWCPDHIEKIRRVVGVVGKIQHKDRSNVIEYPFRKSDGAYVWLESTFRVVRGLKTGHVIELIVISRDISHRKEADRQRHKLQSRIQQLQKLESLGVLAGGIAHDFNNLLVGILGNADLALMDIAPDQPAHELMQNVKESALRASDLTNQMLAYSGKGKFVICKIDINELILETNSLFSESGSEGAVLHCDLAKDLPEVEGDVSQVQQVVTNLITNAIEAVGKNSGTVTVNTKPVQADGDYLSRFYLGEDLKEGLYVSVDIVDTGEGMDKETRKRIFEPFFSTKFTGRGLGLAAVLGIIRGHGGGISVTSKPDEGTTVQVLFPGVEGNSGRDENLSTLEPTTKTGPKNDAVLVIDEEKLVCSIAEKMIKRMGWDVLTAQKPSEAIDLFVTNQDGIKTVLIDMHIPQTDVQKIIEKIKNIRPDTHIFLCSGYKQPDVTSYTTGKITGFIQKPFQFENLSQKLNEQIT